MPRGAHILDIQLQNDYVVMWACVDKEEVEVQRRFLSYMTGEKIEMLCNLNYLKTIQDSNGMVFHIFESI
jgi:hypothetical protein